MEESFQQVEERDCTRKLWLQKIMPNSLDCHRDIVTNIIDNRTVFKVCAMKF